MKGYTKSTIRVAGIMPDDHIKIGDNMFRIREYKQLFLANSVQLILVDVEGRDHPSVILSMENRHFVTVYRKK